MVPMGLICTALAAVFTSLSISLLLFLKKRNKYWEERGVPGPKPRLLFGNVKESVLIRTTEAEVVQKIVPKYKGEKFIGLFNLWKPVILVKEWELAKAVLEKETEHFLDHPPILSEETSDYAFYSLLTMMGEEWKSRRQALNKLFTPKKLKEYLDGMGPALRTMVGKLDGDVECTEALEHFTAQSVTLSLYGLDLSGDPRRTQEVVSNVTQFVHPPRLALVKLVTYSVFPWLFRILKMGVLPPVVWDYARSLYDGLLEARATLKAERDDVLNLIKKMVDEGTPAFDKIDYKEAVGHTFQLLVGGVHTSAVVMSHVLFKLAQTPEVLGKVRNEIEQVLDGAAEITYEHIMEMKYLESVIMETMRLNPLLGVLKRTCTKEYVLENGLRIPKGMEVWIDARNIQRDPKLFPDPDSFLPERWLNGQAEHAAFIAFGKGPRTCIGKRLAEVSMRLALSNIVNKFDLIPSSKNRVPPKFDPQTVIITSTMVGGIWVKFQPRK